jgi:cytochrome c556
MKKLHSVATALLALMLALPATAQFAKPEDAIKYRKASFTVMAAHFGRVGAMASGRAPYDAKAAAENADIAPLLQKAVTRARHVLNQKFGKTAPSTKRLQTRCKPKCLSCLQLPKLAMWTL